MRSLVTTVYHKFFPYTARDKFWRLRDGFQRKLRRLPAESKNSLLYFRRYLSFRLNGRCNACRGRNIVRYKNPLMPPLAFTLYTCRDCGFIFVAPPPDISDEYAEHTTAEFGEGEVVWNTRYLEAIEKYVGRKGRLLEVGFGNASFLQLAHAGGWEVYGAELSVPLVRHASEELGLPNIKLGSVEESGYPDNFFDAVAAFNFIEHVPDPRTTLQAMLRVLRPSGIVALTCPNISGIYHLLMPEILADNDPLKITWIPPHHVNYFNKSTLRTLLEDVGFVFVADESHRTNVLWQQFEVSTGPKVTGEKLRRLLAEIQASDAPKGEARVAAYREEVKKLILERMTWTMLSDLIEIEPILGAEGGILLLGKKPDA
jgi:2-polyprenyl-3-methyl-5-hydroxy-6-metoxy-1,4-benzoquinol methylase